MRCRWCRCEGQAWGMRGAVPPAAWAFAILVASDMLFLRRFPGSFAPFAFSRSVPEPRPRSQAHSWRWALRMAAVQNRLQDLNKTSTTHCNEPQLGLQ